MSKLNEEAINLINEIKIAMVATADKDGKPSVSPRGSVRVVDDSHLAFVNFKSPRAAANLKANPQIAMVYLEPSTRKGVQIWGKCETITSGECLDNINAEFAARNINIKADEVVIVTVEDCCTF